MNLVFPALLLFMFVLPGILFRFAYNRGTWKYPLGRLGPVGEQIPKAIAHAAWLNAAWASFVELLHIDFPRHFPPINYRSTLFWLSNNFGKDQVEFDKATHAIVDHPFYIFLYFLGLYAMSAIAGVFLHYAVRSRKLDRKFNILRFENDWHYQLRGEVLDFPEYNHPFKEHRTSITHEQYRKTVVCAVVDFKDRSCLYLGILIDFFFDQSGNLERILLDSVRRRDFAKDDDIMQSGAPFFHRDKYHVVKGHYFVLRMSEVRTLNFDYLTDEDGENAFRLKEQYEAAPALEAEDDSADEEIRRLAYELWQNRGKPTGSDQEIWLEAERIHRNRSNTFELDLAQPGQQESAVDQS